MKQQAGIGISFWRSPQHLLGGVAIAMKQVLEVMEPPQSCFTVS